MAQKRKVPRLPPFLATSRTKRSQFQVRARLSQIMGERRDLTAAIDIAKSRLQHARHAASRTICEEVRGDYTARVQAVADSLQSFVTAHAFMAALLDDLYQNDIAFTAHLEPLQAPQIADRAERWLAQSSNFLKDKK